MLRLLWTVAWILSLGTLKGAEAPKSSPEPPRHVVVGLSPFLDREIKDDIYRRLVTLLVQDLPGGSAATFYDGYRLKTLCEVEIPTARVFQNERTRVNQFQGPIRQVREFLAHRPGPEDTPLAAQAAALRVPQFLDVVARLDDRAHRPVTVLLLGSPLYIDAREPGFSMMDGYFPSDGHLAASREQTIYGLKERTNALLHDVVHFGYSGDPWASELHRERVERFWSLYMQGQGARLATFTDDLAAVFKALRESKLDFEPPRFNRDPSESKIAMLRLTRHPGQTDWITRDTLSEEPTVTPDTPVGPMKIGIRWRGPVDLDLYARPRAGAETLFFEHPSSPEGFYYKDHRVAPDRDYEYIEFERPVDARQVEAAVNFHSGEISMPVEGEVRVEFANRIYGGTFRLVSLHGNKGRSGTGQQDYWTHLDIVGVLHLPPVATASAGPRR